MVTVVPHNFEQARLPHDFFHQNASSLRKQFALSRGQATEIFRACPECQCITPIPLYAGANPRGLRANELWQSDATHIPTFGRLSYVHVSVDTFSGFLVATAHTGEKERFMDNFCCPTGLEYTTCYRYTAFSYWTSHCRKCPRNPQSYAK